MKGKVIDLFSGCGGMSWGLHKAGYETIAAIDEWDIALTTFARNHPKAKIYNTDIRDLEVNQVMEENNLTHGELDILIGGPPCQGFSKNVPAASRFFDDPRNQLYKDFLRFVEGIFPKVVVIENVAEIYNAFNGKVRDEIVDKLESIGYQVNVKVLFGPEYGIPQRRKRCFFFASRTGLEPIFPEPSHTVKLNQTLFDNKPQFVSAWDAISDLPELENGEGNDIMKYDKKPTNDFQKFMRNGNKVLHNHITRELKGIQLERMQSIKAGQGIKDLPDHIRPKSGYSGAYGRLDFEKVSPTITRWVFHPGSGRYGHPKNARMITMREAARLQCFTDDFIFEGTYTKIAGQIGNAVPSLFMYALSKSIDKCLLFESEKVY
ncbi:DNA cytosine methyltransferase [Tenacibaculum maritimum]|uniref:DNA cytosine methyltransferase n=1 Tax=Tenacibaculum maritimum TaxID=107401 RepID=UPI002306F19A|nr:DNA cytosine methyltransferase [Tenacibaculum maritimum]MDB0600855.1 DNA cytosine methyltransferase [Tenacibaculum maritimum]MDB0612023.1 DNA cytosine methyltransferase [Tenacibaculum maritimum]